MNATEILQQISQSANILQSDGNYYFLYNEYKTEARKAIINENIVRLKQHITELERVLAGA